MARRSNALELAVLGLLHEAPMHGYELRKELNVVLGWGRVLSYGTLYPTLKALVAAGSIQAETTPLDEAELPARGRKARIVYQLTAEGKERFAELLEDAGPSTWDDESFDVRFAFFSRVAVATRIRVLEGRRARLEEKLERVRRAYTTRRRGKDAYRLERQRHRLELAELEIRWLTELIDRERSAQTSPRPDDTVNE